MSNLLDTLNERDMWEDDLEIEELPSIQSATLPIIVVSPGLRPPLTTVRLPV
jgi:hypothetical protein